MKNHKIIRVANVPGALSVILKGQLNHINSHPDFEIIGVSIPGGELDKLSVQEGIRIKGLTMKRGISPFRDIFSIINLSIFLLKEKPLIIHSHTPKAGLVSMIAGFLTRVPIRIHTFTGLIFPAKRGFSKKVLIFSIGYSLLFNTIMIERGTSDYLTSFFKIIPFCFFFTFLFLRLDYNKK